MKHDELSNNHHTPIYNIKAVARLVGLFPVTLRAWERRYGIPTPQRGDQGYRLYSEHDVATLRWLKAQVDSGLSIGRAVDYLNELRQSGKDPAVESSIDFDQPISTEHLQRQFVRALLAFDETEAAAIVRRAFNLYSLDLALMEVIQPTLVELGERWHAGELPIATEHFATQFCLQYLMGMLAVSAPPAREPVIVAAGAPGEYHQIGLLMLVVMLRWRGWDVRYLGPNLSLERLEEALAPLRPRLLLISATRVETIASLLPLPEILGRFPAPKPVVIFGGQAFRDPEHRRLLPGIYVNGTPSEMVFAIEDVLRQQPEAIEG